MGNTKFKFVILMMAAALMAIMVSVLLGGYGIHPLDTLRYLFAGAGGSNAAPDAMLESTLIWNIRLPRVLLSFLCGAALAISGAVFQSCFRNPLVEPYILGVSSGAAFGASLGIVFAGFILSIQFAAFLGAISAVGISYFISRVDKRTSALSLILSGVIVSSVFMALVSGLKYFSDNAALREIVFWMMGGFYFSTWQDVSFVAPVVLAGFIFYSFTGNKADILSLGDEEARSLGVNAGLLRILFVIGATFMTAIVVASVGIVPWVGLLIPHAIRLWLGPENRTVIPGSAFCGGIYLVIADTIARTGTSFEIPVGIVTSLLGAPFLLLILRKALKKVGAGA